MHDILYAATFVLMLLAPCVVATHAIGTYAEAA